MKESTLDKTIAKICARKGAYHRKLVGNEFQRDLPDHLIIYRGRAILLEAKKATGKPSRGQLKELSLIQHRGEAIAELCYSPELLLDIFDAIDSGTPWIGGEYV